MPNWGGDMSDLKFDNIYYYMKAASEQGKSWDDVPEDIRRTYDRLGIPEAEKKYLAGVKAQYESEVVYGSLREDLARQGVIFTDTDSAMQQHPDLFREYFGTVIPPGDNKFAALNSAVWSGGSFIYVPKGVKIDFPLQAYFRINSQNMGQFERTLIIVDEGASVHYVEGCTAPTYSSDSLHSAVVEIIVKRGARCRYTTIQNWSNNVYNLVTKRAMAYGDSLMEWIDGKPRLATHHEIPRNLAHGTRRSWRNALNRIRRQGPAPGRRCENGALCSQHVKSHHQQEHFAWRRSLQLSRACQSAEGRHQLSLKRRLRCSDS
jgi:Fe-S cluster assembly protein SufB